MPALHKFFRIAAATLALAAPCAGTASADGAIARATPWLGGMPLAGMHHFMSGEGIGFYWGLDLPDIALLSGAPLAAGADTDYADADAVPLPPPPPEIVFPETPAPRLGFGVAATSAHAGYDGGAKLGGASYALRFRTSRTVTLAIEAGDWHAAQPNGDAITLQPLLAGTYLYLSGGRLAPYLVVLGGYESSTLASAAGDLEIARALVGEIGAGLELRVGRHVAFDGDLRVMGRRRTSFTFVPAVCPALLGATSCQDAPTDASLGYGSGAQVDLGLTVYL